MTMPVRDLREWMAKADARGDLKRINGADWQIGDWRHHQPVPAPARPTRTALRGYSRLPPGFRVLSNALSSFAVSLPPWRCRRTPPPADRGPLARGDDDARPIPANVVETGPVLENVLTGDAVDMLKFPTPKWHEQDGGRYIGTGDMILTRDPETDWVNSGAYRVMVHDKDHAALMISPGKHGRMNREKYWAKGEPCPVVVVAGQDPLLYMVSGMEVPMASPSTTSPARSAARPSM